MVFQYRQIEHMADLGVWVSGDSLAELFIAAWQGWLALVKPAGTTPPGKMEKFCLEATDAEILLVDFLSEINFNFFARKILVANIEHLEVGDAGSQYNLQAQWQVADRAAQPGYQREIKAVTYHQLKIEHKNGLFQTRIFFDI